MELVYTIEKLSQYIEQQGSKLVLDVETKGTDPKDGKLLGIAMAGLIEPTKAIYTVLQWYDYRTSTWHVNPHYNALLYRLSCYLTGNIVPIELIGHNHVYDRSWIDYSLKCQSKWHACTRIMWHMASAPTGPRPYGLKDAQVEVLGWERKGSEELEAQVSARGGKLKSGDHYLADVEVLGKYACKDAESTALLYNHLSKFFNEHEYWWLLEKMVEYAELLQWCTDSGVLVDIDVLKAQEELLADTRAAYEGQFMELAAPHIARLERIWREDRAAKYTMPAAKERFLKSWEMQKKFKPSSDPNKRELFYDSIQLPIVMETDGGKGSTGVDAIKLASRGREDLKELVEAYETYESAETLLNSFVRPWIGVSGSGRLHPRFNICGTVSYRLSGFKPYLLNAPFDEQGVMSALQCDKGWEGVHADFNSVEPCVTAHYSQDPSLLKVFRDGLGDVYLDLARTLFSENRALQEGYNPKVTITKEIKEQFKEQRAIAKIIQLAVQYTGTEYTVHKNLSYAGMEMTLGEARALVEAYWKHFHKVKVMNEALFLRNKRQGYLRNVVGRIIQVPDSVKILKRDGTIWHKPLDRFKDLPNRFIQSSAHDLLVMWVLNINQAVKEQELKAKPIILDCHDSTSWQAPKEEIPALEAIFTEALTKLNADVKMSVPVKIEMKRFTTLAGLKGKE